MKYQELLKNHIGKECSINGNNAECIIIFGFEREGYTKGALKEVREDYVIIESKENPPHNHVFLLENTSFSF